MGSRGWNVYLGVKIPMSESGRIYASLKLKCEIEIGKFAYVIFTAKENRNNKYERVTEDYSNNSPLILIKIMKEYICSLYWEGGGRFGYLKLIEINYIIHCDVYSNTKRCNIL